MLPLLFHAIEQTGAATGMPTIVFYKSNCFADYPRDRTLGISNEKGKMNSQRA